MTRSEGQGDRMWGLILIGVMLGAGIGAYVGSTLRTGPEPTVIPSGDPEPFTTDPVLSLGAAHAEMLRSGGAAVLADATTQNGVVTAIRTIDVIWDAALPDGSFAVSAGQSRTVDSDRISEAERALIRSWAGAQQVIALIVGQGELVGLARVSQDGHTLIEEDVADGLLFLGAAGHRMALTAFNPAPHTSCTSTFTPDPKRSSLQAVVDYFTILDNSDRASLITDHHERLLRADELVLAGGRSVDEVTGINVSFSLNHIIRQLDADVDEAELNFVPEVPAIIEAPQDATGESIAAFFDASTGELLTWVLLAPVGQHDEGDDPVRYTFQVYLEPPIAPAAVSVVIRPGSGGSSYCDLDAGESILMTIPYDDLAGTRRVWIDLNQGEYREATAEDFASLSNSRSDG